MPRQETRTLYTLAELKAVNPEAYERVYEEWRARCSKSQSPWLEETCDSLLSCVKGFGFTPRDWSIGSCDSDVRVVDPYDNDVAWALDCVERMDEDETDEALLARIGNPSIYRARQRLIDAGYKPDADGNFKFQGLCPWTGYCADDEYAESVWEDVTARGGCSVKEALENLGVVAQRLLSAEEEYEAGEENMLIQWEENEYTIDGEEA